METATLVKAVEKYPVDRPEDLFVVNVSGDIVTVRRDQITET